MSGFPRVPLGDLVIDERPKRKAADAAVWNLNLDQIEPDTGRVLERIWVAEDALGPSTYPFDAGTVLYSKLRPYLNKVVVADEAGYATTELVPLRCNMAKVLPSYLAYFLRSAEFLSFANTVVAGAKMPRMVMSEFWKYEAPLPPLPEQHRIAAILDKADALRTQRREALAQLDRLAQAIFRQTFSDELADPKRRHLQDYVQEFRYGTSEKSGSDGFPTLRIPNVVGERIDIGEIKTVSVSAAEFERLRLVENDMLFVRTNGNPDYVGRSAVFSHAGVAETGYSPDSFIYASYLIRARLHVGELLPSVLQAYLKSPDGKHEVRSRCKTSAGQFNINTEGLGAISVPVLPRVKQVEFDSATSSLREQVERHEASLVHLSELFASLQHRAFRGEL